MKRWFFIIGLVLVLFAAPVFAQINDDFDSAVVVTSLPFTHTENTSYATQAEDDPYWMSSGSVWFAFTPSADMPIRVNTFGTNYDTSLSVWTGTRGALTYVTSNDDFNDRTSQVSFTAVAGQTYYFEVSNWWYNFDFVLTFNLFQISAPPANDSVADAVAITSIPYSLTEDTTGATASESDPSSSCYARSATVWFTYTAVNDIRIQVDTSQSDYYPTSPEVAVFTGTPDSLTSIACGSPKATFQAHAGVTYYIMVGTWEDTAETLVLSVGEAPPPFAVSLKLASTTVDPTTGTATLNTTVACNSAGSVYLDGQIRQRLGNVFLETYFYGSNWCTPDGLAPISITLSPPYYQNSSSLFHGRGALLLRPGKADIVVNVQGWSADTGEYANSSLTSSVLLKSKR